MHLEALSCNNCGAPLHAPPVAKYVTCNHCGAQLAIHRESSVSYTEKIGKIDERTERMAKQLAELRYHQALETIDRDWQREREKYLVTTKHGARKEPSVAGSVIIGVIFAGFGVFAMRTTGPMALIMVLVGIGVATYGIIKAQEFQRAKHMYRLRRSRVSVADFDESLASSETATDGFSSRDEGMTWPGVVETSDDR